MGGGSMSEQIDTARALPAAKATEFSDGKPVEGWIEYAWACAPADADTLLKALPADAALAPLWRGRLTEKSGEVVVMRFRTRSVVVKPAGADAVAEDVARALVGVFA
jgi:hypothetical protein